ncbi:uncharacterized membrane-anchored protein YhcB (DUF1043 family) [Arthrobacter sp. V1I9]|uniref:hypothetical protein n=1 Tax=Arthrobacter sp. V1I9 TaxID=3042275 RepID=UPI0027942D50|nr:hypothetical protein [Arthrobacter sp. V1I9]MDQ0869021.1 uncharacterized membrane-anchored protein YhcB (DUF1043 family) [Arthrobacter sp. V1I9]
MATKPNTEHKEAKTFELGTFVLAMLLNTVLTLIVGVIAGYFIHINMESQVRQSVHADMQLVSSKEQARQQ